MASNGAARKPPVRVHYRTLKIPEITKRLGVQGDENSEVVEIRMRKTYENIDLSAKTILVQTLTQKGDIFDTAAPAVTVEGEELVLLWRVGRVPPSENGKVSVMIQAIDQSDQGKYVWQTEIGEFTVAKSFIRTDSPDPPWNTYFNEILLEVTQARGEAVSSAASATASETSAKASEESARASAAKAVAAAESASSYAMHPTKPNEEGTWDIWDVEGKEYKEHPLPSRFRPRGEYDNDTIYVVCDVVSYKGEGYVAIRQLTQGALPTNPEFWLKIAERGDVGPIGPDGKAATLEITGVATGAPGSQASVTEDAGSTAQARKYKLIIPAGRDGMDGTGSGAGGGAKVAYAQLATSGWSESAPYTQTVNMGSATAGTIGMVDLQLPVDIEAGISTLDAYACITWMETVDGGVIAHCDTERPSVDIDIVLIYFAAGGGTAEAAEKLEVARSIQLSGAITGQVMFDGSEDVDMSTTTAQAMELTDEDIEEIMQ